MSKRARVILGAREVEKLKRGDSLVVRLKSGEEIEIKAGILANWNAYTEGSVESIIRELKRR